MLVAPLMVASTAAAEDPIADPIMTTPLPTEAEGCNTKPSELGLATPMASSGPNRGTAAEPAANDVYFNYDDLRERGVDDGDDGPWKYPVTWAQLICGAADNATIDLGFYFIRAVSNSGIAETDTEVVLRALEWVHKYRNVTVNLVIDGTNACPSIYVTDCYPVLPEVFKQRAIDRFTGPDPSNPSIGRIYTCIQACFNRADTGTYSLSISHEKFINISDTIWDSSPGAHPLVMSSSGNIARSQVRSYHQELSLIYDDMEMWSQFRDRYRGMQSCSAEGDNCAFLKTGGNPQGLIYTPGGKRNTDVWVVPFTRTATDPGRGSAVSFSPQMDTSVDSNVYLEQLRRVDCVADPVVRIAMFKMSDQKAIQFVDVLKALKRDGCDIRTMFTSEVGKTAASPVVLGLFRNAGLELKCSQVPMHTKMVLVGPRGSARGRVLHGTQNMDISGQYLSEEHIISYDPRDADIDHQAVLQTLYAKYSAEWTHIATLGGASTLGACS